MRLICLPLDLPVAAGGEARSADQEAREARSGGHQPGPAGRPGVAQIPPHERDHCKLTVISLSVIRHQHTAGVVYITIRKYSTSLESYCLLIVVNMLFA